MVKHAAALEHVVATLILTRKTNGGLTAEVHASSISRAAFATALEKVASELREAGRKSETPDSTSTAES